MNQDFNLLGNAPSATQRLPTAEQAAWLVGIVLVLGVLSGLFVQWRASVAEDRIVTANAAIEELMLSLQERSQFLAQRNADPALVGKLQQLERESTDKGRMLDLLDGRTLGNTTGFSGYLTALGRRNPDGLWLRKVQIADGGRRIALQGSALDADLVPQFIDALQHEPAFNGVAFDEFKINRPKDGGPVTFSLGSPCAEGQECAEAAAAEAAPPEAGPIPIEPEAAS